jgi:hypothetical protein
VGGSEGAVARRATIASQVVAPAGTGPDGGQGDIENPEERERLTIAHFQLAFPPLLLPSPPLWLRVSVVHPVSGDLKNGGLRHDRNMWFNRLGILADWAMGTVSRQSLDP